MSALVHTATTPGSARAAEVSIETIVRMRMRRAHDPHVQLMRKIDVAGIAPVPGDQRQILDAA